MKRNFALSAFALMITAGTLMFGNSASANGDSIAASPAASTTLVISQVYGAGGNSGATYNVDYIEIKNISSSIQSLSGLALQYGSATGVFGGSTGTNIITLPSVSLTPGQYYLVAMAGGANGAQLPIVADFTSTVINMSGSSGKIALTTSNTFLNCGSAALLCTFPNSAIIDWVAYGAAGNGTAGNGEGGTSVNAGVALTATQGAVRKAAGCTDTDNNNADFDVYPLLSPATPLVPRNSFSTSIQCGSYVPVKSRADFEGDGKTDISVFRPTDGTWYNLNLGAVQWGQNGDIVVPGDYDGDGKADYAVFRASDAAGVPDFFIANSNGTFTYLSLGSTGDIPVAGDYNGDGKSDFAVFRPSTGYWYINTSPTATTQIIQFGQSGDLPFTMDNDADGKSNLAVFRVSNGTWYIARSTGTPAQNFDAIQFGQDSDIPVPADYDGDNRDDVAVFRPSNGYWYILRSSDAQVSYQQFGANGDVPVPGDYDGDGKDDVAVYRSGVWYTSRSATGFGALSFGVASDVPVPAKYHP